LRIFFGKEACEMAKVEYKKRYNNKNLIFVLCGTPGAGKTSLKTAILEKHRDIRL